MKNTELVKVKGILNYSEELGKVKKLEQEKYTIKEAAEYFGCASSQIKGYLTNYKDIFGTTIQKEVPVNGSREILTVSKKGMFFLALLLNKKSKIAEQVFNTVDKLVSEKDAKQISMDEIAASTEKATKDNVVDFNDLKAKKEKKEKEELIEVPELEMTENGLKVVVKKITREELEKRHAEAKERISELFEGILSEIEDEDDYEEDEERCNCPECLKEEINEVIHSVNLDKIRLKHTLDMQLLVTSRYKEICSILGIDDLTASIMIQKFVVNEDENIDTMILEHLLKEKSSDIERKIGSLHHSMELLAIEKFNEDKEDAYIHLVNELKYIIGRDLTSYVIENEYARLLKEIVKLNAYDDAQGVIFTLLSE